MSAEWLANLEADLEALPFVRWDRFTVGEWDDGTVYRTVYGWIERDDQHADFVVLLAWEDGRRYYATSSAEHSERIGRILFGEGSGHNKCRRVEHHFDVENAVRLQTTLEEVS